jgi:hypothetical protein
VAIVLDTIARFASRERTRHPDLAGAFLDEHGLPDP